MIDPYAPMLANLPAEWAAIPEELLARIAARPDALTPDDRAALNRVAAGQHFLVRNDLRERCASCRQGSMPGAVHPYVTIRCVEAPFSSLRQIVLFMTERQDRDLLFSAMSVGSIEPITASKARQLNQRIQDRGGVPIDVQRPLRREEVDADAMRARIWRNVRSLRQKG